MPRELTKPQAYRTWFQNAEMLPGWTVQWQMGQNEIGRLVVSEVRIFKTKSTQALKSNDPAESIALAREHFAPVLPGAGVTTALLRRVRLGHAVQGGRREISGASAPARRPKAHAASEPHPLQWWKALAARRDELMAQGRKDFARVLAEEYGAARGTMRVWLNRVRRAPYNMPPKPTDYWRVPKGTAEIEPPPDRPFLEVTSVARRILGRKS